MSKAIEIYPGASLMCPTITGWGRYTSLKYSNQQVINMHNLPITPENIEALTGIKNRGLEIDPKITTSAMGAVAAKEALDRARLRPSQIDIIIVATTTPDFLIPSTGPLIQNLIKADHAAAYDINAACSGFLFGLAAAFASVQSGMAKTVLVVAAEKFSTIKTRNRLDQALFADGAGAVVVQNAPWTPKKLARPVFDIKSDSADFKALYIPAGGSAERITHESLEMQKDTLVMDGSKVFSIASESMTQSAKRLFKEHNLSANDIDLFISHQANIRIIKMTARKLGIGENKIFTNIQDEGNTSAASIPIAITDAVGQGRLKPGMRVLFTAAGAGFTSASSILEWSEIIPHEKPLPEKARSLAGKLRDWLRFP